MKFWIRSNRNVLFGAAAVLCLLLYACWPLLVGASRVAKMADTPLFDSIQHEPITPVPVSDISDPDKVDIGRRLFQDNRLSHDGNMSCSQCHDLRKGGSDGLPVAIGPDRKELTLNTPSVLNSSLNFRFTWDGHAESIEQLLENEAGHLDMLGTNWTELEPKLANLTDYHAETSRVFGSSLNRRVAVQALTTYIRSLTTPDARFDRYLRGDRQALTQDEIKGYELFKNLGCIGCHQGVNIGGNMYEKLGQVDEYYGFNKSDLGRFNITGRVEDRYHFRVPSLRNVALTAPYFHDGSADTLERAVGVMAYYQIGKRIPDSDVRLIALFLHTLTGERVAEGVH